MNRIGGLIKSERVLIILTIIFFGGLVLLKVVLAAVYKVESSKGATEAGVIHTVYKHHVSEQKDVDKLAKIGNNLLQDKNYYYAALNLKQASDLDANYRDAAYGWAYATVQINQDNLTADALTEIKTGLTRAEKVDPYYAPMLRLKLIVAQAENNQETVKSTEERMTVLGIK